MATIHCPVCQQTIDPAACRTMPFCSSRCRRIDMARWLDERHSLPIYRFDEDEDAEGGERAESDRGSDE